MEGGSLTIASHSVISLGSGSNLIVPQAIADEGDDAINRFVNFFTAHIRNPNTRVAYGRAVMRFFRWAESAGLPPLQQMQPYHLAAYVEVLSEAIAPPSVKQHLAAIRMLFDYLVLGQVMDSNPATAVRGPRYVVSKGKTPVLSPEEARAILDAIPIDTIIGLRDRALIGTLVYTFSRIGAALSMDVEDAFYQRGRLWMRLAEKGGKAHQMPCHHNLEDYLNAYLDEGSLRADPKAPLFQSIEKRRHLSGRSLDAVNAYEMVRRRARQAGIKTEICNHTFRATGITAYLLNGGTLETAAAMAAHSSTRTTQLYDRRSDEVTLDEVERVHI